MLDALRKLSTTPRSKGRQNRPKDEFDEVLDHQLLDTSTSHRSHTAGSSSNPYEPRTPLGSIPGSLNGSLTGSVPYNSMPYNNAPPSSVYGPYYGSNFVPPGLSGWEDPSANSVTPHWKAIKPGFAPQSPPQEKFIVPQGEKRRRVSRVKPVQSPEQPPTPQTPPGSRRRGQHQHQHQHYQPQQQQQHQQQHHQQQYATQQQYGAQPPYAGFSTGFGLAPAMDYPTQPVLLKPPVVPSMVPSRRAWKPRDVQLPRIVDGRLTPEVECDDDGGHYIVRPGERFASRYVIVKLLGQGTFGKVAQAWDERTQQQCAIKIIRAIPKYRDASRIELRVLSLLSGYDPRAFKCVRMRECFDYRNHVCIVTDLHDISVYDFLHDNKFAPFPGKHIAQFAQQIIASVAHIHSLGLVHTDLKPENVLLTSSTHTSVPYTAPAGRRKSSKTKISSRRELNSTDVTLIDFGSAVFEDEYHPSVVSTRHYRAPEIIFGSGWSYPCDLWSIGCLLVELCTGRVLFETKDDLEHLHMMERTLATRFDADQLGAASANSTGAAFVKTWPPTLRALEEQARIDAVDRVLTVGDLVAAYAPLDEDPDFWRGFLDLVGRLMMPNPSKRITAAEALQHPWILSA